MGRYRRSKTHNKNKIYSKHLKPKNTKYDDQIYTDLQNPEKNPNLHEGDDEKPACGQHYCVICSRYFISESTLQAHQASKIHKRRVKMMQKGEVYMGPDQKVDNGPPIVRPEPME